MAVAADAPTLLLVIPTVLAGLALVAGLIVAVHRARVRGARLQSIEQALQETRQELAEAQAERANRAQVLLEMEREVARLKRVPKAELLPMMQLAHELRSPLATVQSSLEMVLQGYADSDSGLHDEMLVIAQNRAIAMLERVNDFLRLGAVRYAEIERKPHPVELTEILRRLAPQMNVRAKWVAVNLHVHIPDVLPKIVATSEDIEHMLSNLVNNAIKYTDPGGHVTVSLREQEGNVIGVVEDTGIGIPADEVPLIFHEFYRGSNARDRTQGTGLGLSIVRRVVDLYGGRIQVASDLGKGSIFTFSFPIIQEAKEMAT
jgi:two-component system phosphate regulon sensor histidine kinase PhoR